MGSVNAQKLAHKITENLRLGKKTVLSKEMLAIGYSVQTSTKPKNVTETKSFKTALAMEQKAIVANIDSDIARVQQAFATKNLTKEKAKTLTDMLDTLIKNKQLLSGGATANVGIAISISEHVAGKYGNTSADMSNESPKDTS
jgi:hypothetical protein